MSPFALTARPVTRACLERRTVLASIGGASSMTSNVRQRNVSSTRRAHVAMPSYPSGCLSARVESFDLRCQLRRTCTGFRFIFE